MPLFETIPIETEEVRRLVQEHWGLELGNCIKASQNHTFIATSSKGDDNDKPIQFIVRVTPDPENNRSEGIQVELTLLDFLQSHSLSVCAAIPSQKTHSLMIREKDLDICVFNFAKGAPVVYTEWTWMTDRTYVTGVGRWMSRLHQLTRQFAQERPELVQKIRNWTELHDNLLAEAPVDPHDVELQKDPQAFGIIHGDINPSNYFWEAETQLPCVFDWDQMQMSWFAYDLAQPIWGVVMKKGDPDTPGWELANPELYTDWLLEGYESELPNGEKVDRAVLKRMLGLRRELYRRFCTKALDELDPESFMGKFCAKVVEWFRREDAANQEQQQQQQS
jgi:Ser/Thr protein kinase RdoA (MazF antagonist)